MVILALDQCTSKTGWAVLINGKLKTTGTIDHSKETNLAARISMMAEDILDLVQKYQPDLIGLEDIHMKPNSNVKVYRALAMMLGYLMVLCYQHQLKCKAVSVSEWCSSCGITEKTSSEIKLAALEFCKQIYGATVPQDEADALCIAFHLDGRKKVARVKPR